MQYLQKFQKNYAQATWRKQLQLIGAFLLALVLLWMIAALYLDVTARAAAIGREIQELEVRSSSYTIDSLANPDSKKLSIEELRQINRDLETQLAYLTSEEVMQERAEKLGFEPVSSEQLLYLQVPGYVPRQVAQIAPPPGPLVENYSTAPPVPKSMLTWLRENYYQTLELVKGTQP